MLQLPHRYLSPSLGIHQLILLYAFLFTLLFNVAFFRNAELVYGGSLQGWGFLGSLAVFLFAVTVLFLSLYDTPPNRYSPYCCWWARLRPTS
jgi:glucan phosphoethanolaminetransferase (alkaline phosphatase superfamily)